MFAVLLVDDSLVVCLRLLVHLNSSLVYEGREEDDLKNRAGLSEPAGPSDRNYRNLLLVMTRENIPACFVFCLDRFGFKIPNPL